MSKPLQEKVEKAAWWEDKTTDWGRYIFNWFIVIMMVIWLPFLFSPAFQFARNVVQTAPEVPKILGEPLKDHDIKSFDGCLFSDKCETEFEISGANNKKKILLNIEKRDGAWVLMSVSEITATP